jgi:hypothetical protein
MSAVQEVVQLLTHAGYADLGAHVEVAGIPFEFGSLLVGTTLATDIVVVADTVAEPSRRLRQRLDALATALDVSESRRSLTLVTVGPAPPPKAVEAMSRVARILVVRPEVSMNPGALRDALAVLLPLDLPRARGDLAEPFGEVEAWIQRQHGRRPLEGLLGAAEEGPEGVQRELAGYLAEPLRQVEDE